MFSFVFRHDTYGRPKLRKLVPSRGIHLTGTIYIYMLIQAHSASFYDDQSLRPLLSAINFVYVALSMAIPSSSALLDTLEADFPFRYAWASECAVAGAYQEVLPFIDPLLICMVEYAVTNPFSYYELEVEHNGEEWCFPPDFLSEHRICSSNQFDRYHSLFHCLQFFGHMLVSDVFLPDQGMDDDMVSDLDHTGIDVRVGIMCQLLDGLRTAEGLQCLQQVCAFRSLPPSEQPSDSPSEQPSYSPSVPPSSLPSDMPPFAPSSQPIETPSVAPSSLPSETPSFAPSSLPSGMPSMTPSIEPSAKPSSVPSGMPSLVPSFRPYLQPSFIPSGMSSLPPSSRLSSSFAPSSIPSSTFEPTHKSSQVPSVVPSSTLSMEVVMAPTHSDVQAIIEVEMATRLFLGGLKSFDVPISGVELDSFLIVIESAIATVISSSPGSAVVKALAIQFQDSKIHQVGVSIVARVECYLNNCFDPALSKAILADYLEALQLSVASGALGKEIAGEAATSGVDSLLEASTEPNSYNLISYSVEVTVASEGTVGSSACTLHPLIASVLFSLLVGVLE